MAAHQLLDVQFPLRRWNDPNSGRSQLAKEALGLGPSLPEEFEQLQFVGWREP